MSNNAVSAYENGEKPLSQWTKGDIISEVEKISKETALSFDIAGLKKIPGPMLKNICLKQTSWHHTSEYYNRTNFYSLDVDKIVSLTDKDIKSYQEIAKENAKIAKENAKEPTAEKWECSFLEWSGTKAHPKATTITEIGTLKGNWFIRSDGSKKSVNAKGFRKLNPVDENSELAAKPVEVKTSRPKTISKQRKPVTKKPTAEVSLPPWLKIVESLTDEERKRLKEAYRTPNFDWCNCKDIKEIYNLSWSDLEIVASKADKPLMKIAESLTDEERKRLNAAYRTPNFDWRNCKDIKEIYNLSLDELKILASIAEKTEPNKMSVVGQLAEIKAEQNQVKAAKPLQKKQTLSIDK